MCGRPFDEESQARIKEEAVAFFEILEGVHQRKYELIGSLILDDEIEQIEETDKREAVKALVNLFVGDKIQKFSKSFHEEIKLLGLKDKDAMHMAFAIGNSDYFITCDDEILNRKAQIENAYDIKVVSPVGFVKEVL